MRPFSSFAHFFSDSLFLLLLIYNKKKKKHLWVCGGYSTFVELCVLVCESLCVGMGWGYWNVRWEAPHLCEVPTVDTLFQTLQAHDSGMFIMCRKVSGDIESEGVAVPKVLCN